jgi:hypothetical protein
MSGDVTDPAADVPPPTFAEAALRSRAISVSSTPRVAVAASPATADPDGVEVFPEPRLQATSRIPSVTVKHASVRLVIAFAPIAITSPQSRVAP